MCVINTYVKDCDNDIPVYPGMFLYLLHIASCNIPLSIKKSTWENQHSITSKGSPVHEAVLPPTYLAGRDLARPACTWVIERDL